jgi:hypothetical protein
MLPVDVTLYKQAALAGIKATKHVVDFTMRTYRSLASSLEHVMLIKGDVQGARYVSFPSFSEVCLFFGTGRLIQPIPLTASVVAAML